MKGFTGVVCFFCLLFTGCNFAPKYSRPSQPLPSTWRVDSELGEDVATSNWWKHLGDEVLYELIQKALYNNRDLQIAIQRVNYIAVILSYEKSMPTVRKAKISATLQASK